MSRETSSDYTFKTRGDVYSLILDLLTERRRFPAPRITVSSLQLSAVSIMIEAGSTVGNPLAVASIHPPLKPAVAHSEHVANHTLPKEHESA